MLTVSLCDRNASSGNRSGSRTSRCRCARTQIDVTASHTAAALLTHGAVRSRRAVWRHFTTADT